MRVTFLLTENPKTMASYRVIEEGGLLKLVIEEEDCSICLRPLDDDGVVLHLKICQHKFHPQCLLRWSLTRFNCPMCRRTLAQGMKIFPA